MHSRLTEDAHVPGTAAFLISNDGRQRVGEETEQLVLQFDFNAENSVQELADVVVIYGHQNKTSECQSETRNAPEMSVVSQRSS